MYLDQATLEKEYNCCINLQLLRKKKEKAGIAGIESADILSQQITVGNHVYFLQEMSIKTLIMHISEVCSKNTVRMNFGIELFTLKIPWPISI